MTQEELNQAIMRDVQLHEHFELRYHVWGWSVRYYSDDGERDTEFLGETPMAAMEACFSQIRNLRGRT